MNKKVKVIGIIILAYLLAISSLAYALGALTLTVTPSTVNVGSGATDEVTIATGTVQTPTSATVTLSSSLPLFWSYFYYTKATVTVSFGAAPANGVVYDVIIHFISPTGEVLTGGVGQFTGDGTNVDFTVDIPLNPWLERTQLPGLKVNLTVLPQP